MWLFLNDSFVSIVEHRDDPRLLLVRGRFKGDAARFLGLTAAAEIELHQADYRFRIVADRREVERALVRAILRVRYPNFKDSIRTTWRKSIAMRVWSTLAAAQADRGGR